MIGQPIADSIFIYVNIYIYNSFLIVVLIFMCIFSDK